MLTDPVNPYLAGVLIGLVLGTFLAAWAVVPALMYRRHRKARRRLAETAPDGIPAVPASGDGEAA